MQREHFYARHSHRHIEQLANMLTNTMLKCGYETVELPVIESAELFLTKAGDQLITKLFTFERQGQQLALRPEFTALAVHRYLTDNVGGIVRWQFNGSIFSDDHPADSYQRFSVGAELIGMAGPAADAEILTMAAQGIDGQGLRDWQLIIGHVGLMRHLLKCFNLDTRTERFLLNHRGDLKNPAQGKAYVLDLLDQLLLAPGSETFPMSAQAGDAIEEASSTQHILDVLLDASSYGNTMGGRTREDIARRLLQKYRRSAERNQIVAAVDFLERWVSIDAPPDKAFREIEHLIKEVDGGEDAYEVLEEWRTTVDLFGTSGISLDKVQIRPELARSWDYYTGVVFELQAQTTKHLGGGGRYDELIHLMGGREHVPAVGFAYYIDTLLEVLPGLSTTQVRNTCIKTSRESQHTGLLWAQSLRRNNVPVCILPENAPDDGMIVLFAQEDGSIRMGTISFSTDQLELLLDRLTRTQYS